MSRHVDGHVVPPPATIGMLGGGQLGRYTLIAARKMGYRTVVLEPDERAPAGAVADEHIVAAYDDAGCARSVGRGVRRCHDRVRERAVDVARAPGALDDRRTVGGGGGDRAGSAIRETLPHRDRAPGRAMGRGGVGRRASRRRVPCNFEDGSARVRRQGPGRRSRRSITSATRGPSSAGAPCVLERALALESEVSVIVARTADGRTATYEVSENHHVNGVLDLTVVPARVAGPVAERATELALAVADALDYVGVLAVELFVVDGELYVNELAPRPHNSGHWTLDAARTSQFEQQVRAVCGLGLGATTMTAPAVAMVNLLGDLWQRGDPDWAVALAEPRASLHLYGKADARPGRKMGHLTITGALPDDVASEACELRDAISRSH